MTPPAPIVAPPAREAFLDAVRAADLFNPLQLTRAEAAVPSSVATPTDAARAMVAAGFLTKFQAERLLAGRTDGYHLGPYVIQEQIGSGPMGRVYRARHRTMNRLVAIKILSADLTRTAAARQTFQREVRAAAQLNHPNVVTAYDANELTDRFYLVLEFVDGPNLETLVRERGPLPIAEARELICQVALGLDHAHTHGMVHRDVKPANLLVTRPSRTSPEYLVKIADFGIAKLKPAQTSMPGLQESPDYVAPELAQNSPRADLRSDLYSLGAVLYFLLTGQPPFPGGTVEEKIRRHCREEPVRIERLRDDVPPVMAALLHQLLAKNPDARPPSAAVVVGRLAEFAGGRGEAVCFELPAPHVGAYSFVAGQLSGAYSIPMAEPVPELSGRSPAPPCGHSPVAGASADVSSWEQITGRHQATTEAAEASRRTRPRSGGSMWMMGGLTTGMLVVGVAAVSVVIKALAK